MKFATFSALVSQNLCGVLGKNFAKWEKVSVESKLGILDDTHSGVDCVQFGVNERHHPRCRDEGSTRTFCQPFSLA